MSYSERRLYALITVLLTATVAAGFVVQGFEASVSGFAAIQRHPARLINDFTQIGGDGAAMVNAALTALIGLLVVRRTAVRLSGPTVAAVFTILGFGLFGKTPFNILPVMFGVYTTARLLRKSFKEYVLIALFGTALGPVASSVALEAGLVGPLAVLAGAAGGYAVGLFLPAAAMAMLRMHQGFNLYNIGLTSGFVGLFVAGLFTAMGNPLPSMLVWNAEPSLFLIMYIPLLALSLIVGALWLEGFHGWAQFIKTQSFPGRLPSDFMDMGSPAGSLINMALLALGGWAYVLAVGGALNGPVLGGILTVIGFGAFGKNLRNCWPVVAGVAAATLVFGMGLNSPGPLLAALFATTLAPLAGEFGVVVGFLAGFTHLIMVNRSGAWHSGMNLYNNGFAGGLTATLFVAVIEWYRANRHQVPAEKSVKEEKSKRPVAAPAQPSSAKTVAAGCEG